MAALLFVVLSYLCILSSTGKTIRFHYVLLLTSGRSVETQFVNLTASRLVAIDGQNLLLAIKLIP